MNAKRIAFISDIHGNLTALEAVLADLAANCVDEIVCLGDIASIGPQPAACLERIRELGCLTIQGNHELYMLGQLADPEWQSCPTWWPLRWSMSRVTEAHRSFMAGLPVRAELAETGVPTLLVHGSPRSPYLGFLPRHADEEIAHRMQGEKGRVVICGHTHLVLYRSWQGSLIVNAGSVGMTLDGRPVAQYVIGTRTSGRGWGWQFEFREVTYNKDQLAASLRSSGQLADGNGLTALFVEQMMTGKPAVGEFLVRIRKGARETGKSVAELFYEYENEVQHIADRYGIGA